MMLADVMRTVMNGYGDRPALGQRAVEFVSDAAGGGRTVAAPVRHLTYGETWARVRALADAFAGDPVPPSDCVATLGSPVRTTPSRTWHCR